MEGTGYLLECQRLIAQGPLEPRRRLEAAAHQFWKAMLYEDSWPPALSKQAFQLVLTIFAHGTINQTVEKMSDQQIHEAVKELEAFLNDFLRQARPPAPRVTL